MVGGSRLHLLVSASHRVCLFVFFVRQATLVRIVSLHRGELMPAGEKRALRVASDGPVSHPPGWRGGNSNIPRCFMLRILQLGTSCVVICGPKCGLTFFKVSQWCFMQPDPGPDYCLFYCIIKFDSL